MGFQSLAEGRQGRSHIFRQTVRDMDGPSTWKVRRQWASVGRTIAVCGRRADLGERRRDDARHPRGIQRGLRHLLGDRSQPRRRGAHLGAPVARRGARRRHGRRQGRRPSTRPAAVRSAARESVGDRGQPHPARVRRHRLPRTRGNSSVVTGELYSRIDMPTHDAWLTVDYCNGRWHAQLYFTTSGSKNYSK